MESKVSVTPPIMELMSVDGVNSKSKEAASPDSLTESGLLHVTKVLLGTVCLVEAADGNER